MKYPVAISIDQIPKLDAVATKNFYGEGESIEEIQRSKEVSDIPPKVDAVVNKNSYGESESVEEIKHANEETDASLSASLSKAEDEEIRCDDVKLCEPNTSEPGDATPDSTLAGNQPRFSSPGKLSTSHSSYCTDKQKISESSNLRIAMSSSHSTLEDPNFVENYFKVKEKDIGVF